MRPPADGRRPVGSRQPAVSTTIAAAAAVADRLPGVKHHRLENREASLELGEGEGADAELGGRGGVLDEHATPVLFWLYFRFFMSETAHTHEKVQACSCFLGG